MTYGRPIVFAAIIEMRALMAIVPQLQCVVLNVCDSLDAVTLPKSIKRLYVGGTLIKVVIDIPVEIACSDEIFDRRFCLRSVNLCRCKNVATQEK